MGSFSRWNAITRFIYNHEESLQDILLNNFCEVGEIIWNH